MTTTLTDLTRTIDNAFVTTWYEIRPEAIDNILDATVIWAVMRAAGAMKPQVGGSLITRTIRYGETEAEAIERGDELPVGEDELETMAIWTWRTIASRVQRDLFDDQENSGPSKIKDLVGMKLTAARDGMEQKLEGDMTGAFQASETTKVFQSLHDMVPPRANRTSGAYGRINRPSAYEDNSATYGVEAPTAAATNGWWGPKYLQGELNDIEANLLDDMRRLFNGVHRNQSPPNLFLTDQSTFETYELLAVDVIQIVKDRGNFFADLGFESLQFKGKPFVWTPDMTANHILFLNTDFIEIIYDPNYWFDMTAWKPAGPRSTKRIAHIIAFVNMISTQLRRHGRLEYA